MKKLLRYIPLLALAVIVSCTITEEGLDKAAVINVSVDKMEVDAIGGKETITITSYCDWTQRVSYKNSSTGWVKLSPSKGVSGTNHVTVTFDENKSMYDRNATIIISNDRYDLSQSIEIHQKAAEPFILLDKSEIEVTGDGETIGLIVNSNIDYTITSSESWARTSSVSGIKGENKISITIDNSPVTEPRSATITFSGKEHDTTATFSITQKELVPTIEVNTESIKVVAAGETKSVTLESNISWEASCDADWVTVTPTNGENGTYTLKVKVAENTNTAARETVVTVSNSEYNIEKQIAVSQEAFGPYINIGIESISAPAAGITKSLTLERSISWEASCDAEWVTITPTKGDRGTSTIKIEVAANTKTVARESVVEIFNTEYNIEKHIAVSQVAFVPFINVTEAIFTAPATGTTRNITIDGNISWKVSCDADWVTITPANGDKSTSTIKIEVAANTQTVIRESVVKVVNEEYNIEKQVAVIYQSAFNPTLNVSTESISAPAAGTLKSITLEGNISWEASCDANWVIIAPANGNQGTSTLMVNVASNTNTTARNTIVKVFNSEYNIEKQIAITQEGFIISIKTDISSIVDIPACGATYSFNLESNVSWIASCSANWATVSRTNGNASSYNITITVDCVDTFDESRYCEIYISSNDGTVRKTISLYQLAGYGGWGIVGAHQDNPWDITSPIPMSHYPSKDGIYILHNVKLVSDGFKFAKFGLNDWNDPTTYFGAWGETAGYSYFDYGYMVGFDWYYLENGIDSQQQSNIGVSDWSKRYDILLYIPYDDDGASYARFAVLETGSYSL